MQFLYKNDDGELVFKEAVVRVIDDNDPDIEEFLAGKYKKYEMIYDNPPVYFVLVAKGGLFKKRYVVYDARYKDSMHEFVLAEPVSGKAAQIFAENFEKILENPKNIVLLPYLDTLGASFQVSEIPYYSYYSDEMYYLGHGLFETLFVTNKKTYLETYSVDLEISMGRKEIVSLFNSIFSCKTHNCVFEALPGKVKVINTKRILTRDLYDVITYPIVRALVFDGEAFYFSVIGKNHKEVRFYTDPDRESIYAIGDASGKRMDVSMLYSDFKRMLDKMMGDLSD